MLDLDLSLQAANQAGERSHAGAQNCQDHVPVMIFTGFGKAYVPHQVLCEIYSAKEGFVRGTIFPELDIPYEPIRGTGRGGNRHD